jgi:hypothetical protein
MAAPTNAANVKKVLANSEPSTHGTKLTSPSALHMSAYDPKRASGLVAICGRLCAISHSLPGRNLL